MARPPQLGLSERATAKAKLKKDIIDRLDRPEGHTLKSRVYMERTSKGVNDKVLCKVCGTVIVSLVPVSSTMETDPYGTKIVRERTSMAATNDYVVVTLEMDNGAKHQTPMCKTCAPKLTQDQLEDVYMADLETFLDEEENQRSGSPPWEYLDTRPVKVLRTD